MFGPSWRGPDRVAGPRALIAIVVTAVLAAVVLTWDRPGIGWPVVGLAGVGSVVALTTQRGPGLIERLLWSVATVGLLAVGAIRAAEWLFVLCVLAAFLCVCFAVAGGRTLRGMSLGIGAVAIAAFRGLPWVRRGLQEVRGRAGGSASRTLVAVAVSLVLLLVFGALLAGGDSAFSNLLAATLPEVDPGVVARWLWSFVFVTLLMVGLFFVATAPPSLEGGPGSRRPLRRIEWALPVGTLVALFAVFVAVQATVLFGGGGHVLRTDGLTYANYARSGFWQLSAVTVLTLLVIAVAARKSARETVSDRLWLRILLGALAILSLVIVASALTRMWAYEQAYGFTRLRLLVSVCEIWLGSVFVLVLVSGIRLRARWLSGAIAGLAVVGLLGIAVINPDAFIAQRNIERYFQTGRIDTYYLSQLSEDVVPAVAELPDAQRDCVLRGIQDRVNSEPDPWYAWNLGRHQASPVLRSFTRGYGAGYRLCRD